MAAFESAARRGLRTAWHRDSRVSEPKWILQKPIFATYLLVQDKYECEWKTSVFCFVAQDGLVFELILTIIDLGTLISFYETFYTVNSEKGTRVLCVAMHLVTQKSYVVQFGALIIDRNRNNICRWCSVFHYCSKVI